MKQSRQALKDWAKQQPQAEQLLRLDEEALQAWLHNEISQRQWLVTFKPDNQICLEPLEPCTP